MGNKPAAKHMPWRLEREISRSILVRGVGDDEYVCGQILGMDRDDESLVEAAPDMLAALKGVLVVADRKTDEFDAVRAAIAKAGRE